MTRQKLDKICWYVFLSYIFVIVSYGLLQLFNGFIQDEIGILNPYTGRAFMYLEYGGGDNY